MCETVDKEIWAVQFEKLGTRFETPLSYRLAKKYIDIQDVKHNGWRNLSGPIWELDSKQNFHIKQEEYRI